MISSNKPWVEPRDDPPSINVGVAKLRLKLRHINLPELEAVGLVWWDREQNVVRESTQFAERQP